MTYPRPIAPPPPPGGLQLEIDIIERTAFLTVRGELDLVTAPDLEVALSLAARPNTTVQLDLSELDFIDTRGLQVLHQARHAAHGDNWTLTIAWASPATARLFEITGTEYWQAAA